MSDTLFARARLWLAQDPDSETQAELANLIAQAEQGNAEARAELAARFNGRLQFGTAGLRGRLQAGPMGMNRVLVAQAAAGLAAYLHQYDSEPSIVIGYDGRKNSDVFARDTAEIMAAAGVRTHLLPRPLPTPVLAYALRDFDATAGVMVTASHNPPEDNGYKVYLGKANGGGQIVSPADRDIAALIEQAAAGDIRELPRSTDYTTLDEAVLQRYIAATAAPYRNTETRTLNYVYTALHGVGKDTLLRVLQQTGMPLPHLVAEQAEADSRFPTVAFPNPEEAGALDLAIKLASEKHAELIIANDPDADRLALAVPDDDGRWQVLHGNTVGCLLAWDIAQRAQAQGKTGTLACSLVSSPALADIAAHYGFQHAETLTGFKYIAKVPKLIYGFEEALGYLVDPDKVRDKDGISAALAVLDLVSRLKAAGKTLSQHINDFTAQFGAYASSQIALRVANPADTSRLTAAFRQNPPVQIGTQRVTRSKDYLHDSEPADILVYHLANGSRLIVRPSGTEPKVKLYLDVKGSSRDDAQQQLQQFDQAVRELLRRDCYDAQHC